MNEQKISVSRATLFGMEADLLDLGRAFLLLNMVCDAAGEGPLETAEVEALVMVIDQARQMHERTLEAWRSLLPERPEIASAA